MITLSSGIKINYFDDMEPACWTTPLCKLTDCENQVWRVFIDDFEFYSDKVGI